MPAEDRPPSFQFYPREWLLDSRRLTPDQRGRYIDALCESWVAESYGSAPEHRWREWLGYSSEEWPSVRTAFAQRFKIRGGKWIQERMAKIRAEQIARYEQAKRGADKTNEARAQRTHSDRSATRSATAPASASASALEDREPKHLSPDGDARAPIRKAEPEPEGFAQFYAAYPRHDGRRAAALEFKRALKRHPTYNPSDLHAAAEQFAAQVEAEQRDPQFIAMPKVWLHQDRFREYFDEDDDAQTQEPAQDHTA